MSVGVNVLSSGWRTRQARGWIAIDGQPRSLGRFISCGGECVAKAKTTALAAMPHRPAAGLAPLSDGLRRVPAWKRGRTLDGTELIGWAWLGAINRACKARTVAQLVAEGYGAGRRL